MILIREFYPSSLILSECSIRQFQTCKHSDCLPLHASSGSPQEMGLSKGRYYSSRAAGQWKGVHEGDPKMAEQQGQDCLGS